MLNILVVDDETPIREWIVYCIERMSKEDFNVVSSAKSGKEAYDMVLKYKPDVVITDIKMPGMDGIELMKMVKKILPYTVFIILTNYAEFSYAREAILCGAKQYLLKSELRSSDLMEILESILKEKTNILEGKKNDILSNGYIDLFMLYQNFEDKEFCASFWQKYGMNEDKPYCIIGVLEDSLIEQRQEIVNIAMEIYPYYFNAALRHQIVYIVLQEETKELLEKNAYKMADSYFKKTGKCVAIGAIEENLNSFIKGCEIVQTILRSSFFVKEKKVFYYNEFIDNIRLDRKKVRQEYKDVLSFVLLKQYEKARLELNNWFDNFTQLHIEDIEWSKEICLKMVVSMEVRLYQLNSEHIEIGVELKNLNTCTKCKEACLHINDILWKRENGTYSRNIQDALKYINQNFNKDISLIEVAKHIHCSPEYFSRLFKEETGENFSIYLTMYRLSRADQLLKESDLNISQIAYQVGYSTPGYFSKIYKKHMGMTPGEARCQNNSKMSR